MYITTVLMAVAIMEILVGTGDNEDTGGYL
jgi:hypothetical protein